MDSHLRDSFIAIPPSEPGVFLYYSKQIDVIGQFLSDLSSYKILTRAEEYDLFLQLIAARESGNQRLWLHLRERATKHNGRLVMSVLKRYRRTAERKGLLIEDLLEEGLIGLIRAIDKFDPERGNKFSTMAIWWIRQQITRAIADAGTIRKPVHVNEKYEKIQTHTRRMQGQLNRMPRPEEICESLKRDPAAVKKLVTKNNPAITPELLQEICAHFRSTPSLDLIIDEHEKGKTTLGDLQEDTSVVPAEDWLAGNDLIALAHKMLNDENSRLSDREREVITLRFGLDDGEPKKLSEVGALLNLSSERVRQLQNKAIRKLRSPALRKAYSAATDLLVG